MTRILVVCCDITKMEVDAIVNAAQNSLKRGGGVDGAIHDAAGPELELESLSLGGCPTGEVRTTKAYRLYAKYVIHTVGPVWRERHLDGTEDEMLASCYRRSLEEADRLGCKSIAFPAISTGIYQFPIHRAAQIAYREVSRYTGGLQDIYLVSHDPDTYRALLKAAGY